MYHECNRGCCAIYVKEVPLLPMRRRTHAKKAGAFIYDPENQKVLLVQSRGQLWGPPKGTLELERGESFRDCAIREVKEETGLDISQEDLTKTIVVNRSVYFYIERKVEPVAIQEELKDNDANGITWISIDCLQDCVQSGKIILNYHGKQLFRKLFRIRFPRVEFTVVTRRR